MTRAPTQRPSASQFIFDPSAPIEAQLGDSIGKGFISGADADRLLAADRWLNENWDRLSEEFPGQAVTVVQDDSIDTGFATYVGDSSLESENKARQFSPNVPFVTLEPRLFARDPSLLANEIAGLVDLLNDAMKQVADARPTLRKGDADGKGEDAMKELIEVLEKLRKDGKLGDDKLVEILPPQLVGGGSFVGGVVADGGGHENIKIWHIDTGASVSCITKENFERLQKKGAKPKQEGEVEVSTADGVKKYPKYSGLPMSFGRKNKKGKSELVKCDVPLIVASADLLGLDQLKNTGTKLIIDPAGNSVELAER